MPSKTIFVSSAPASPIVRVGVVPPIVTGLITLPVTPRLQTNTQIPDIWNEGVYIDANNKYAAFLGHSDKIFLTIKMFFLFFVE